MEGHSFDTSALPNSKAIWRGAQIFIGFSVVGVIFSTWWKSSISPGELFNQMDWRLVLLLLPLLAVDYWVGGWRYRLFFNGKQLPFISHWDCMRSNWANMAMGAITPFHSGAGPAQLFILWRRGASIADGMLVTLINYVATLVFFLVSSIAALTWIPADVFGQNFTPVFRTGFGIVVAVVSLTLLVLLFPQTGTPVVRGIMAILPLGNENRMKLLQKVETEVQRFHDGFRKILKGNKSGLVLTVFATFLLYFNKYVIGYTIVCALGISVPFGIFVGLQIVQFLLLYFAPTPGASGLAELSTVWLMGKIMPESLLLVYAIAQRIITLGAAAIIGGVVMIQEVRALNDRQG